MIIISKPKLTYERLADGCLQLNMSIDVRGMREAAQYLVVRMTFLQMRQKTTNIYSWGYFNN